jgi:hypothetical protein
MHELSCRKLAHILPLDFAVALREAWRNQKRP